MNRHRLTTLDIATPEGVVFSLPLAGVVTRATATFIDFLVAMAAMSLVENVLAFGLLIVPDLSMGALMLIRFAVFEGYRAVSEMLWNGQTIGKRVTGIRVMDERGLKLRPSQVLVRNLVRLADALPAFYAVGGTACLFSRRCQRLGDLAAGTIVVIARKAKPPNIEGVMGGKYNSFRQFPHLEARLRQKISRDTASAALAAIVRGDELEPEARVRLFTGMAAHFRELVTFPEEASFGLTDEQYVRNVVDTLHRRK